MNKQLAPGDRAQFGRQDFAGHVSDDQRKYISGTHFEIRHRNGEGARSATRTVRTGHN